MKTTLRTMPKFALIPATISLALASFNTLASDATVLNHNFESDAIPLTTNKTTYISGWVKNGSGAIGVHVPEKDIDYTDLGGRGQTAYLEATGKFYQSPQVKVVSGETYTLTFDVGRALDQTDLSLIARVKANGLSLAQLQLNKTSVEQGAWGTHSLTFTATDTMPIDSQIAIEFFNASLDSTNRLDLDNIKLTTSTNAAMIESGAPAPKTLTILDTTTVLSVPNDYADINAALRYLDDKYINNNVVVTIDVKDCTDQVYYYPIEIAHPQGKQIEIIGNPADPNGCVLQFNSSNGFVVSGNYNVRKINGFHIKGNRNGDTAGVLADKGASVTLGASTKLTNFHNGVKAINGGKVYANTVLSTQHTGSGFVSQYNGYIKADGSQSNDNILNGYHALEGGKMHVHNSKAVGNNYHGYAAELTGHINARNSEATSNVEAGFFATGKAFLDAYRSAANKNDYGFKCDYGAYIYRAEATLDGENRVSYRPSPGSYHYNCYMH